MDLNKICETISIYDEDLYVGVKALAAVNITFYSPKEDGPFLRKHAVENFSYLTLDSTNATTTPANVGINSTTALLSILILLKLNPTVNFLPK